MVLPWKGSVGVKAYREFESPRFRNLRLATGASLPSWVMDGRLSPPDRDCADRPAATPVRENKRLMEAGECSC